MKLVRQIEQKEYSDWTKHDYKVIPRIEIGSERTLVRAATLRPSGDGAVDDVEHESGDQGDCRSGVLRS